MKSRTRCLLFALLLLLATVATSQELKYVDLGNLELESGETLRHARIAYRTLGELDEAKSNGVLFPTWFTGTTEQLLGPASMVDTSKFFLIAVGALGNGVSISPSNSESQAGDAFPRVTIGDMVQSQYRLLTEVLGIDHLHAVMGISMGGMQTFEWITTHPDFMDRAVSIVGSPQLGSYDILLWQTGLAAIELGRRSGDEAAAQGLVGMIDQLALQTPGYHDRTTAHEESSRLLAEARGAGAAMDLEDRAVQLQAMIDHDVARNFGGSLDDAAAAVEAEFLNVVGLRDHMVTPSPALRFAEQIGAGSLSLESDCGHLTFVCDLERIQTTVRGFLDH